MWRRRPDAGGKLLPVRSCGTGQDGKSSHNWRASKVDADDPESSPTALWPSGDFTDSPASRYDTTPQCRISTLSHSAASAWLPARKRSKKNLRHLLFITLVLPLFTTRALGALRPPARVANRGAAKSIPAASRRFGSPGGSGVPPLRLSRGKRRPAASSLPGKRRLAASFPMAPPHSPRTHQTHPTPWARNTTAPHPQTSRHPPPPTARPPTDTSAHLRLPLYLRLAIHKINGHDAQVVRGAHHFNNWRLSVSDSTRI